MLLHFFHLLQPLNINIFNPLKTSYNKILQNVTQLNINSINKLKFLFLYQQIHMNAFTQKNIKFIFSEVNITPYDLNHVLNKLLSKFHILFPPTIKFFSLFL